nr:hypothetical protein [Tanacetum cinerariifolium]
KRHCILVPAFWFLRFLSCDLVLRFGPAFCLETSCVLPKDKLLFATPCVLLQDTLRFASRQAAFCFKTRYVLLQDILCFASRRAAFCFKTSCVFLQDPCVLSQDSCVLSHGGTAFYLLLKTLSAFCGPYKPTTVLVQAVAATDDSPVIPEHTTIETPINMSPANKAHFEAKKEAMHLILTGIGDEIYSTVDVYQTAQEI